MNLCTGGTGFRDISRSACKETMCRRASLWVMWDSEVSSKVLVIYIEI